MELKKGTEIDNQPLARDFSKITDKLKQLLSGLSEEELNKIPFPGSWTAGQLGDHLLKSYKVGEILTGKTIDTERKPDEKLQGIRSLFLDFSIKMESPDFIIPSNDQISKVALLGSLRHSISNIIEIVNRPDFDITRTCLDFELPESGTLTRWEWIGF